LNLEIRQLEERGIAEKTERNVRNRAQDNANAHRVNQRPRLASRDPDSRAGAYHLVTSARGNSACGFSACASFRLCHRTQTPRLRLNFSAFEKCPNQPRSEAKTTLNPADATRQIKPGGFCAELL